MSNDSRYSKLFEVGIGIRIMFKLIVEPGLYNASIQVFYIPIVDNNIYH